jgi:ATP synthase protein I
VVRVILLAVLFVLGLQLFELAPLPVVLTFVVMQVGQVFNLKGKQRLTD